MVKRALYVLLSVLLLSLPWLGGTAVTLFVAFVPLLWIEQDLSDKVGKKGKPLRFWPYPILVFALWWLATTWWVGFAAVIGTVASVVIGTVLMGTVFLIYHAVWRRAKRALAYTILVTGWIAYEYLYLNSLVAFPWLVLGNGFAVDVKLVQWYEYTGTLGGSLWVLVVNLLVFEAIRQRRRWMGWGAPVVALLVPAVVSFVIYYTHKESQQQALFTVIQPNIDPYDEKFELSQRELNLRLLQLMDHSPKEVDFIVAPETAINEAFWEDQLADAPSIQLFRDYIRLRRPSAMLVAGSNTYRSYTSEADASATARYQDGLWYDVYNSSLSLDSTSRIGIHRKAKLVPGAELTAYYFLRKMEFLKLDLGGISGQLGMDSVRRVFTSAQGIRVGGAICYEAIYGEYFTEFVRNGAQVMCVISNDGWWNDTPGHRYLFAYSRLRAIETRRSIARSANTGKSGFINQRGDELQSLGWNQRGILTQLLSLNDRITFYVRYGDVLGRLSIYVWVLGLLYFMAYRVRKKSHMV